MKAILVIDMPKDCWDCPCFMDVGWRCQCRLDIDEDVHDGRPEWCPLKPTVKAIPIEWIKSKKIEYEHDRYDYVRGCFDGFNDCIDYLINEWEKENE